MIAGSDSCTINWQYPGGKPLEGEGVLETCYREVYEETNLELKSFCVMPTFFGYYLIESYNTATKEKTDEFLQLRLLVKLALPADKLPLAPNEREGDTGQIVSVQACTLEEAYQVIPWLRETEENHTFIARISPLL
ncbi:MAG: NUDIX domain-containing protein [Candidatus Dojkabacteria bacterium]